MHEHHDNEESLVFQQIEEMAGEPGLMTANVDQHAAFHGGLETLHTYLEAVKAGEDKYDGKRLRSIIDSFMPVLREHLFDEIKTMLALEKYKDKGDWAGWLKKVQEVIVGKMQQDPDSKVSAPSSFVRPILTARAYCTVQYTTMPMFMYHHDETFDNDILPKWPPLPWIVHMLVSWVFARKHKSWWRFAPSDINGRPREMPFAD